MLAIRLQRIGRSGHPEYRMIVQESRRTPTSGKIVTSLGNYNPHTKALSIDKDKAVFYVNNGAQPSPRVAKLLSDEGLSLPKWVEFARKKESSIKNQDKLRKNRPVEEVEVAPEAPESVEAPEVEETPEATAAAEEAPEDATTVE